MGKGSCLFVFPQFSLKVLMCSCCAIHLLVLEPTFSRFQWRLGTTALQEFTGTPAPDCYCRDVVSHGMNNYRIFGLSIRRQSLLDYLDYILLVTVINYIYINKNIVIELLNIYI